MLKGKLCRAWGYAPDHRQGLLPTRHTDNMDSFADLDDWQWFTTRLNATIPKIFFPSPLLSTLLVFQGSFLHQSPTCLAELSPLHYAHLQTKSLNTLDIQYAFGNRIFAFYYA